jgi:hypothetical protein
VSAPQAAPITRKQAGRAPGFPFRPTRLFHRTIEQAPRAHEIQDTAAQGPAQPRPGRWRPSAAVTAHRTRPGAQERSDHRSVAGITGQKERHLRLVTGRESCGQLGLLFRVEEGIVTLATRRLPAIPGDTRRTDVHDFKSLPEAVCGQRTASTSRAISPRWASPTPGSGYGPGSEMPTGAVRHIGASTPPGEDRGPARGRLIRHRRRDAG